MGLGVKKVDQLPWKLNSYDKKCIKSVYSQKIKKPLSYEVWVFV